MTHYTVRQLRTEDNMPNFMRLGYWAAFTADSPTAHTVQASAAATVAWIEARGGSWTSPEPVATDDVEQQPQEPRSARPKSEWVSCDRCSAKAVVTLVTNGRGYLSFCGHHNRAHQHRYDVFRVAKPATNTLSDSFLERVVDGFLDSTVGHHETTEV